MRVTGRIFSFFKSKELEEQVASSEKVDVTDWYFLDRHWIRNAIEFSYSFTIHPVIQASDTYIKS